MKQTENVGQLLDAIGPPPEEIRLDWSRQLSALEQTMTLAELPPASSTADKSLREPTTSLREPPPTSAYRQLTWNELLIDAQGLLTIQPHDVGGAQNTEAAGRATHPIWCADNLQTDLLRWANSQSSCPIQPQGSMEGAKSCDTSELGEAAVASSVGQSGGAAAPATKKQDAVENKSSSLKANESATAGSAQTRSNSRGKGMPSNSSQAAKIAAIRPQHLATAVTIVALLLFGLYAIFNLETWDSTESDTASITPQDNATTSVSDSQVDTALLRPNAGAEQTLTLSPDTLLSLAADDSKPVMDDAKTDSASKGGLDSLSVDALAIDSLDISSSARGRRVRLKDDLSDEPISSEDEEQSAGKQSIDTNAALNRAVPDSLDAADVDVLSELAAVTQQSKAAHTDLSLELATTGASPQSNRPAFTINTYPVLQVQRLPLSVVPRVRRPAWILHLAASEGLQVEPSEPLEISGTSGATWKITAMENGDPDTRSPRSHVFVQVQQTGNRGNALRWMVTLVADDLSQVHFPMGQQYLDLLLANLAQAAASTQAGLDRLKALSSSRGVPSIVRSQISEQREFHESQLKLVSRLREIAADAMHLDALLDGQIEVRALFIDLDSRDSPPLLKFGDSGTLLADFADPPKSGASQAQPVTSTPTNSDEH